MNKVLELKRHIRNIFDAVREGEYRKQTFLYEHKVPDTDIVHCHRLTYSNREHGICFDYNYRPKGIKSNQNLQLAIYSVYDDAQNYDSFLIFNEKKEIYFRFVPASMDSLYVAINVRGNIVQRIPLKEILTEEQFFMYTTLYDLPDFEDVKSLAVMGYEFRGEMLRARVSMCGSLPQEIVDIESEEFLHEVMYG